MKYVWLVVVTILLSGCAQRVPTNICISVGDCVMPAPAAPASGPAKQARKEAYGS